MAPANCPLCKEAAEEDYSDPSCVGIRCGTCGSYLVTPEAVDDLSILDAPKRRMVSCLVRERSAQGGRRLTICSNSYKPSGDRPGIGIAEMLDSLGPHSAAEQIDRALSNLARRSRYTWDIIELDPDKDWPLLFVEDPPKLGAAIRYMSDAGLVQLEGSAKHGDRSVQRCLLTVKGWERIEELRRLQPHSRQSFVAMWFSADLMEVWEQGVEPAIKEAGYVPFRSDVVPFNEKIDDRIIAEIRRSRFMVADVTGHRQAVYFEAGFAMGLGLPVIFTCQADHLEQCNFDTRQYNHIVWQLPEDLRNKLRDRIVATIV